MKPRGNAVSRNSQNAPKYVHVVMVQWQRGNLVFVMKNSSLVVSRKTYACYLLTME